MNGRHQRYVSGELTHFVGRGRSRRYQFELLVKILKTGWLVARGLQPEGSKPVDHVTTTHFRWDRKLSDNMMYLPSMVCFCDIPVADLGLHVSKYGRFGLAFSKDFLVPKGASPVFYIAKAAEYTVVREGEWPIQ